MCAMKGAVALYSLFQMVRKGFFALNSQVPEERKEELQQEILFYNLHRMRIMAVAVMVLMAGFLLLEALFHNHSASPYFGKDMTFLVIVRITLISGSLLFLMILDIPSHARDTGLHHRVQWTLFMFFFFIGTGMLTFSLQSYRASFNPYTLAMFSATALFILPPVLSRLLFATAWLIMVGIAVAYHATTHELVYDIFGATLVPLVAHILSWIVYVSWVREFFNGQIIAEQNKGLESANRQLAENNRILQNLAVLDGVGVTPNRRYFEALLEREWKRAIRMKTTVSVIIIEVGQFDDFYSRYGRQVGEECIVHVTRALMRQAGRSSDVVARFEDDRFGVLLPDTDHSGALVVARRMQKAVANLGIVHEDSPTKTFQLTYGCSSHAPDSDENHMNMVSWAEHDLAQVKDNIRQLA